MEDNKEILKDDYVSIDVAKLLKAKGFDEPCQYVWGVYKQKSAKIKEDRIASYSFMEGETSVNKTDIDALLKYQKDYGFEEYEDAYLCPTHQLAMKWLRKKHKIFVVPKFDFYAGNYTGRVYDGNRESASEKDDYIAVVGFDTYEHACDEGIKYALVNLI